MERHDPGTAAPPDPDRLRRRLDDPAVRARLVRFCRTLTGDDHEAAEDLAQETLLDALARADRLHAPEDPLPWLYAAARIRGLRRRRTAGRDAVRFLSADGAAESLADASLPDPLDGLARAERSALLDRALGRLPAPARGVLVGHYLTETDAAAVSTGAERVRLHRARLALRRVLETDLRREALAHGLFVGGDDPGWQPGPVWCFRCGAARLEYRFERADGPGVALRFAARCPDCDAPGSERVAFSSEHPALDAAAVLAGVKGCKPALGRINAWWHAHIRSGLDDGRMPCPRCGGAMPLRPPAADAAGQPGPSWRCEACADGFFVPVIGLAFHSPEVQAFWRRYPRIRPDAEHPVRVAGRDAGILTRYAAVGSSARIEIVYRREDLRVVAVSGAVRPDPIEEGETP